MPKATLKKPAKKQAQSLKTQLKEYEEKFEQMANEQRELQRALHEKEEQYNALVASQAHFRRPLADRTNSTSGTSRKLPIQCVSTDSDVDSDSDDATLSSDSATDQDIADLRRAGSKFVMLYSPWVTGPRLYENSLVFNASFDPSDPDQRFVDDILTGQFDRTLLVQGQLHDLQAMLAPRLIQLRTTPVFVTSFHRQMTQRRSEVVSRLRHDAVRIFGPELARNVQDSTSAQRTKKRGRDNGSVKQPDLVKHDAFERYPILYDPPTETFEYSTLFRSRALLNAAIASLRGTPAVARESVDSRPSPPKHTCTQALLEIDHTTPAFIAFSAVAVIYTFSADTEFACVGGITRIPYERYFNIYLKTIMTGLKKGDDEMIQLMALWNRVVFGRSERGGNNTADIAARLERTHVQSSEAISFAVCEKHINALRMPYIPDSHVGNDDTGADFDLAGEEGRNARGLTRT